MEQKKNREWVKNAAIIFLAVLLVLTFFSNTIMNRSLPEVATQNVTSGSIVARVRGTGVVTAVGASQVKADKAREIRSVLVKVGQKVEPGDVLFTLGAGTTEEIEAAEEKVRNLQASYNRTAAGAPLYDYTTDWRKMNNLKEAWDAAEAKVKELEQEIQANSANDANKARLDGVNAKIAAAEQLVQKCEEILQKQLEEKQTTLNNYYNSDEKYRREQLEKEKTDLATQRDSANTQQETYETYTRLVSEVSDLESQIKVLEQEEFDYKATETTLNQYLSPIKERIQELETQAKPYRDELETLDPIQDKDRIEELKALLAPIEQELSEKEAEKAKIEKQLDPMSVDLRKDKLDALREKLQETNDAIQTIKDNNNGNTPTDQTGTISNLESRINELANLLKQEDTKASQVQEAIDALIAVSEEDYNTAKDKLDAAKLEKEVLLEQINTQKSSEYKTAVEAAKTAEDAYRTAQETLAFNMANDARTASVTGVELSDLNEQIEVAKKKLAELTGEDQQITAKVSGIIQTIDTTAGSVVKKDDIPCTIEVPDMGYTMSFSVTNDQANRVRPGDTATVSNFYWGNEVTATLNNIKVDPKNPQNKLLTFDLDGNVTAGSQLTISVGQKSANYDIIIPSSAIRTDANGSFVLRVDAKNSPLGNRYIARRVQVEVLASDDSNSAVTGDLNNGDYVITTSTSPIKSGQLVRLANY